MALVKVLERRYGTKHQNDVYRARFWTRTHNRGETLQQLAQDLDSMAHRAYPGASPDLLVVLLKDQFVDALDSTKLKIQVKQSQPVTLQEALTRALEFESYVRSSLPSFRTESSSGLKARKGQVQETERFKGTCWYYEKIGHKQEDLQAETRAREGQFREEHGEEKCLQNYKRGTAEQPTKMEKLKMAGVEGERPVCLTRAPLLRKCKLSTVSSVQVEGEINGIRCPLVIDTASERTFVRLDVVCHRQLPETSQQLCGITGQCAELKGPIMKGDPAVAGEDFEKLQLEDQDLQPVVEWMSQSSVRPAWETISGASPTTKNYCTQWDALRLKDGLLQREWVTTDGLNRVMVDQFFCRFGISHELHSDQGRNSETAIEWDQKLPGLLMAHWSAAYESAGYKRAKLMLGHELRLPVDLLTGRPPDEEIPEETTSYVKSLRERLTEAHYQVRGALEFSGDVMKLNHDVKASQVFYKYGNKVWLYNPLRKKGQSPKLQSPWEGPYMAVERLSDVTYRIKGGRKAQPKVVHANRLWQYHGTGQYTWKVSKEQLPTTDEDQTGDPGGTQGSTDPGNPTMDQEEEHRSFLAELDVTGEGDHSENVTEILHQRRTLNTF
ncbi:hypothetical protein Hamer_G005932 [Homarus americanus]|uniref:Integrase p58-like C-terminal domain-containing protein n=1 Tax=Homarus americanus TaxID=6706 RepID=A0A8J5MN32_HOMAM|nr:hypothetical protein Hamer_G005932 [Homarus americanus]